MNRKENGKTGELLPLLRKKRGDGGRRVDSRRIRRGTPRGVGPQLTPGGDPNAVAAGAHTANPLFVKRRPQVRGRGSFHPESPSLDADHLSCQCRKPPSNNPLPL